MYWLGKAQLGKALAADPNNSNARNQAFATAINTFKDAAYKSESTRGPGRLRRPSDAARDPARTGRRPPRGRRSRRPAGQIYDQVVNEKLLPERAEEVLQRAVTAYHLAGDVATSEARVATFKQQFPNSPLLPLVLFRSAENSFVKAEQLAKQNNPGGAKQAPCRGRDEIRGTHREVPGVRARQPRPFRPRRCASRPSRTGRRRPRHSKPSRRRSATATSRRVPYVLADCLIRTAPAKAEDALQDNMLREKLADRRGAPRWLHRRQPEGRGDARRAPEVRPLPQAARHSTRTGQRAERRAPEGPCRPRTTAARVPAIAARRPRPPGAGEGAGPSGRQGRTRSTHCGSSRNDPLQKSPVAPLASSSPWPRCCASRTRLRPRWTCCSRPGRSSRGN